MIHVPLHSWMLRPICFADPFDVRPSNRNSNLVRHLRSFSVYQTFFSIISAFLLAISHSSSFSILSSISMHFASTGVLAKPKRFIKLKNQIFNCDSRPSMQTGSGRVHHAVTEKKSRKIVFFFVKLPKFYCILCCCLFDCNTEPCNAVLCKIAYEDSVFWGGFWSFG